ncbi:hypothetical protein V525_17325 [Gordonia alkanivorans CGMCC 6845]|uniref:Uncharacterized protein n=1 Tax=Gordonia alkanivorans CGMCC 6845 TaxID=1423140 RepID=W9D8J6_9ACTN|nr:hypothetical protein V525_17325 [Gordonia alkanivorans CGMCC 6845]
MRLEPAWIAAGPTHGFLSDHRLNPLTLRRLRQRSGWRQITLQDG